MAFLEYLLFWKFKQPGDNDWHPQVGRGAPSYSDTLPEILKRTDFEATLVDAAYFVTGVGVLQHVSQIHDFGFTAHASVFRNVKTMVAMHKSVILFVPMILTLQAAGIQYRTLMPRWCHERERGRDDAEARRHVEAGAYIGGTSWVARMLLKIGVRYWAPIDVVIGGAVCDVLHREYVRTHSF